MECVGPGCIQWPVITTFRHTSYVVRVDHGKAHEHREVTTEHWCVDCYRRLGKYLMDGAWRNGARDGGWSST